MERIQITVTGGQYSEILEAGIIARARKLTRETLPHATCHIAVNIARVTPNEQGRFYVQIHVQLSNTNIFVGLGQHGDSGPENPLVAVRRAFAIAEQHVRDHVARHATCVPSQSVEEPSDLQTDPLGACLRVFAPSARAES